MKYVRLIVPNEIMNLNRKMFYCLYNLKTIKNSSGHLKCTATFTMQLMQLFSPQNPRMDLFSVTQKTFVSLERNWKQYNSVGNKNCIMDSYIEHRQQCTLFTPPKFCTAIFFHFSRDDCDTLGKLKLQYHLFTHRALRSSYELVETCPYVADRIGIW